MSVAVVAAWGVWALAILLSAVGGVLVLLTLQVSVPDNWGFRGYWDLTGALGATIGLLVARRQPRNPIGWLLLVSGLASAFNGFVQEYATQAFVVRRVTLPLALELAWIGSWSWSFAVAPLATFIPQLFPTGRPLTPRWRPVLWASWLFIPTIIVAFGLRPGPVENAGFVDNPLGTIEPLTDLRDSFATPLMVVSVLTAVAAVMSLALRFRRSRGVERLQLKWVALSGVFQLVAIVWIVVTTPVGGTNESKLAQLVTIAALCTLPIAIGIAMLRYRLYDIDLVINRTIVYAVVSALLGTTYVAAVVLFQAVLRPLTGGSELAVAASTLLVVALFQPIRARVQELVDRRFYRSRYDASRTLNAFTSRLRGDVDLDSVRHDLVRVVDETVRPAHASVWLREGRR